MCGAPSTDVFIKDKREARSSSTSTEGAWASEMLSPSPTGCCAGVKPGGCSEDVAAREGFMAGHELRMARQTTESWGLSAGSTPGNAVSVSQEVERAS